MASTSDTPVPFITRRRVEFKDTDAAGIVHFSAFFPWMESAEHELLRSLGIPILPQSEPNSPVDAVTWPRVSSACDFRAAARFEDLLDIEVAIEKIGSSSVHYRFTFSRKDAGKRTFLAFGSMVSVCCRLMPGGGLEKAEIPAITREKLERFKQQQVFE